MSLGTEADHGEITAWAHEMRAWINLTTGDYHGVVTAARAGTQVTPQSSVAVQLAAQEAKAWTRIGDRRQTEVALDRGRRPLDSMPYPDNLDHHFVVDPTKFDFYAMDCYRLLADDKMAENLAGEVIQASTDFDGKERAPMRLAEARITLGVVAARQGDLDEAVSQGQHALSGQRRSAGAKSMEPGAAIWHTAVTPSFHTCGRCPCSRSGIVRDRAEPVKPVCARRATAPVELPGERTREDGLD